MADGKADKGATVPAVNGRSVIKPSALSTMTVAVGRNRSLHRGINGRGPEY
jgi:hypothetical protein